MHVGVKAAKTAVIITTATSTLATKSLRDVAQKLTNISLLLNISCAF